MDTIISLFSQIPTVAKPQREAPKAFGSDAFVQFAKGELTAEQAVRVAHFEKAHEGLKMPSAEERTKVYENGRHRRGCGC